MSDAKRCSVEQYLKEGLLALVPLYEENGGKTAVLTIKGSRPEGRTTRWLVDRIASCYSLDLRALRRRCAGLLDIKTHVSLAVHESLVLLPVKMRRALTPGETTIGYINMLQVEKILNAGPGHEPWLSRVLFKGGRELGTLNTAATLHLRLRQGEIVLTDYRQRCERGAAFNGLRRDQLLKQLPNCDCILRSMFAGILDLGGD